ncbi:cold-shock protein, partial [Salmonella enterica]
MKGTIARLTDRGFGFITPEDGSKDVFFHAREVKNVQYNDLKEGDAVTFD